MSRKAGPTELEATLAPIRDALAELSGETDAGPAVSIYLPVEHTGPESRQNAIRLKNRVGAAEDELRACGAAEARLASLRELAERWSPDPKAWADLDRGLALFAGAGRARQLSLPEAPEELAIVAPRYYLQPLLRIAARDERFHVLALSQNAVDLFLGNRYRLEAIELGAEVPRSLVDAVGHELSDPQLQLHSGGGVANPTYHGQAAGKDDVKPEIARFFSTLAGRLAGYLRPDTPVVLAGVEYLLPIYREAADDPNVLADGIGGNPQPLSADDLHRRAVRVLEPHWAQARADAAARFAELSGTGRVSSRLDDILPAALEGRVETLFMSAAGRRWGRFDPDTRAVEHHEKPVPGSSIELCDLAAVHAYANGGRLYAVDAGEVPGDGTLAAVFRY